MWIGSQFKEHHLYRRLLLAIVLYMTWCVVSWSFDYAVLAIEKPGADVALVIGALTAPITMLLGYTFKLYTEGRKAT